MSFKQTKHWDSEVMRSLEKVAYEKGLIKPEPLQKQASLSKTADITPTSDLMQNIIKLCIALRAEGLVKEAAEVETNFFNYKKAQTLYEVTKEKGEDLVDAAHPQGSHKLEGLDSEEAVVEDIVDRHNKMKAVVDKKPTGKYSSTKDILNAVKVTLGADPLANGRANSSRKIAQEIAPKKNESGSTATGVVDTLAVGTTLWGVTKLFNSVGKFLGNAKAAWKIVGLAEDIELRSLTEAQLSKLAIQLATKVGPKTMQAVVSDVGPAVLKAAAPEMEQLALNFGTKAIPAAAEASGMGAWLSGIGESAWAGLTTPIGSVGAEGVSMVGGAGGAAAAGGAIAAGGVLGMIFGNFLFNSKYNIKDVMEAGQRVVSDLDDEDSNLNPQDKVYKAKFSNTLKQLSTLMPQKDKLLSGASKQDVLDLVHFNDLLSTSTQQAQDIWSIAQGHQEEQRLGWFRGMSTVKIHASNYIKVAGELRDIIMSALKEVRAKSETYMKQQSDATGGGSDLIQTYATYAKQIDQWKAKANALQTVGKLPNADKVFIWLNQADKEVKVRQDKLKDTKDPAIVKIYLDDFNEKIKPKLDAFRDKGPLK